MKTKRILACLLASVMACGAFTACGDKEEDSSSSSESSVEESSKEEEVTTDESSDDESESSKEESSKTPVAVDTADFEEAVVAESGDAYLAITDSQWWVQYWGKNEDLLTYDAGVVPITGNGSYTVSVTADTNGFRYDALGDVNGEYVCGGIAFAAVIINDGEKVCPDAIITIDKIRVDGEEIELTAKGYTNTEEGAIRSNIYNEWVSSPTSDARCADGFLYKDYDTNSPNLDNVADYSAQIVNVDDFGEWTTIEVDFTITGMAE